MASTLNQIPGRESKILGWTRQLSMLSIPLLHPLTKTKCFHFSFEPLFSNFTHTKPAQYNLITTKQLEFHWKRSKVHVKAIMSLYVIKLWSLCLVLMGMVDLLKYKWEHIWFHFQITYLSLCSLPLLLSLNLNISVMEPWEKTWHLQVEINVVNKLTNINGVAK